MELQLLRVKETTGQQALSPQAIAEMMAEEGKADRECFWVLHLNNNLEVIEKELVAIGALDTAIVHPREVFKKAIINSAHSIVTIHNHPSGNNEPSDEDKAIWSILHQAGDLLRIEVRDNLIITPSGKYYSEAAS